MPTKAGTCSMGTLGRVEHRARNASGHREDMPHCRPDDVRGGFVLCRCVEWADLARRLERRHGQNVGGKRVLTCRPRLFSPFALCRTSDPSTAARMHTWCMPAVERLFGRLRSPVRRKAVMHCGGAPRRNEVRAHAIPRQCTRRRSRSTRGACGTESVLLAKASRTSLEFEAACRTFVVARAVRPSRRLQR